MIYLVLANKVKDEENNVTISFKDVNNLVVFYNCVAEIMCDYVEVIVEDNEEEVVFSKKCKDFNNLEQAINEIKNL